MSHDDFMLEIDNAISEAERDAANLFAKISVKLWEEEAIRIFTKVLKRPGRRTTSQSQNLNRWLLGLYGAGATNWDILAEWALKHYPKEAHSVDAVKQRIKRL